MGVVALSAEAGSRSRFVAAARSAGCVGVVLVALCAASFPLQSQRNPSPPASASNVSRRDSAGINIVVTRPDSSAMTAVFLVDTAPAVRLGSPTAADILPVREISGAVVLRSGAIVVGDRTSATLRFFSRYGVFAKQSGAPGSGPGAFRSQRSVAARGDTVLACCAPGVALYSASGAFLSSTPEFRGDFLGAMSNGRYLIRRSTDETRAYQGQKGVVKTLIVDTLFSIDRSGAASGRLATLSSRVHVGVYNPDPNPLGLSVTFLETPFEPESYYATAGNGFLFSDGRSLEVSYYTTAGRLQRIARLDIPPTAVTRAAVDQFRQAVLRKYTVDETKRYIDWVLGQYVAPNMLPQVRAVVAAPDGGAWIREHAFPAGANARWFVFAPDGNYRGHVILPSRWKVHQVGGDFLVASEINQAGFPVAAVYRLSPVGSAGRGRGGSAGRKE